MFVGSHRRRDRRPLEPVDLTRVLPAQAAVVVDAVARLVPGVVGDEASVAEDSFSGGLLDHPHYTRPAVWRDRPVPDVLVSGHHGEIERWRREQRLSRTQARRPDLLAGKRSERVE